MQKMEIMLKVRDISLDVIRIIACAMIIMMHSPHPLANAGNGMFLVLVSYLCAPGVGLFFMVSGALILGGNVVERKFDAFSFLKRRVVRIGVPLAFWVIVGRSLEYVGVDNVENGVLWFLYCMSGLYLLTPILRRWMGQATMREVEFYLAIWMVTLFVPVMRLFYPMMRFLGYDVFVGDTSFLYYFHGYAGYYVLGGYMNRHYGHKDSVLYRWRKWMFVPVLLLSILFPVVLKIMKVNVDFYNLFWYLGISVVLMYLALWMALKRMCDRINRSPKWIATLSTLTFGIYLVHILVMRNVLWKMDWMVRLNGCVQTFVCFALTFTVSLVLCWGLSKVKYVRMVIGM